MLRLGLVLLVFLSSEGLFAQESALRTWMASRPAELEGPFRGEFVQIRTVPSLEEPIRTTGRIWGDAAGKFRLENGTPPSSYVICDGKQVTMASKTRLGGWTHRSGAVDSPRVRPMSILMGKQGPETLDALETEFEEVRAERTSSGGLLVVLKPRSSELRKGVASLEIEWGGQAVGRRLIAFCLSDSDGGKTTIEIGKVTPVAKLPPHLFDATQLPKSNAPKSRFAP